MIEFDFAGIPRASPSRFCARSLSPRLHFRETISHPPVQVRPLDWMQSMQATRAQNSPSAYPYVFSPY